MKMIKQVSTPVVEQQVDPSIEKKKLEKEHQKKLEELMDAYEKKTIEDVTKKEDKKEAEPELPVEDFDDTYLYDDAGVKRINIYSNKRRRELEKKLKPLELEPIIFRRRAEQEIPISDKLTIKVRETSGKEDVFVKELIARSILKEETTRTVTGTKQSLYIITFMLLEINGQVFPDVVIKNSPATEAETKAFNEKFDYISDLPDDLLEIINLHLVWFKDRIRRMSIGDVGLF